MTQQQAPIINVDPYVVRIYNGILDKHLQFLRVREWSAAALRVAYRLSATEADQLQGMLENTPIHPHWKQ